MMKKRTTSLHHSAFVLLHSKNGAWRRCLWRFRNLLVGSAHFPLPDGSTAVSSRFAPLSNDEVGCFRCVLTWADRKCRRGRRAGDFCAIMDSCLTSGGVGLWMFYRARLEWRGGAGLSAVAGLIFNLSSMPQNFSAVAGRLSGFFPGEIAWRKHCRARRTRRRRRHNPCAWQ